MSDDEENTKKQKYEFKNLPITIQDFTLSLIFRKQSKSQGSQGMSPRRTDEEEDSIEHALGPKVCKLDVFAKSLHTQQLASSDRMSNRTRRRSYTLKVKMLSN